MFYVYEWYVIKTNEIFYVGKGSKKRYLCLSKRSKLFKFYIENFKCKSRIVKYYETEDEAFIGEHQRIVELKAIGQAKCNIDLGGKGGAVKDWSDEKREFYSKNNIMKASEQKERMKNNNPMKSKEISEKVAVQRRKAVIINGVMYKGVLEAERQTKHSSSSIIKWCKRGYDDNGNPCKYDGEEYKPIPSIMTKHPKATTPKAVIVDGIHFDTVEDGAKYIGGWSENLIRAIKHNRKYKGHTCKYDNQQPSHTNTN